MLDDNEHCWHGHFMITHICNNHGMNYDVTRPALSETPQNNDTPNFIHHLHISCWNIGLVLKMWTSYLFTEWHIYTKVGETAPLNLWWFRIAHEHDTNVRYHEREPGGCLYINICLTSIGIPMLKIRRSCDRLIFNMGIPIPGKDGLYIEMGPWG